MSAMPCIASASPAEAWDRPASVVAGNLCEGIVAAVGTSIIATDAEGAIVFVNRAAQEMLGYRAEELIGQTPDEFPDLEELSGRSDCRFRRRDGQSLTVSLRVTAILDAAGDVLGFVGIGEDVTDERWAHQLLREALAKEGEAHERLNAVNQAKDDFIATVGHELRTPLASILGYTELLQQGEGGPLNDDQALLLSRVESNAARLARLAEDLLTVARVESEPFVARDEAADLNGVVRAALAACEGIKRPGLDLEVRLDPSTPTVRGAADDLQRAVVHLLTNAATYTGDGGHVAISTHHTGTDSYLVVADTGVGIPATEQGQVFVPFFRSSLSHDRAIQGAGVGLSIVKAVVTAYGGEVSVSSEEGQGAVFIVRLPSAPETNGVVSFVGSASLPLRTGT
jgi:PAS domain S-box-containing protein